MGEAIQGQTRQAAHTGACIREAISLSKQTMAIFAIDPGKTTGLAWGVFRDAGSTEQTLRFGKLTGDAQIQGLDSLDSARLIVEQLQTFMKTVQRSKFGGEIHLVIEDFVLRPNDATADRAMLTPVEITAMVTGILFGVYGALMPVAVYQMPSEAKGFATTERLKAWGVRVRGWHAVDAWRHVAVFIAKQGVIASRQKRKAKT